jgi:hypothetical protein
MYGFIVAEYEFIYACIWNHIHYEFIYLWIHIINYEFIVDTMNSYLPRIQMVNFKLNDGGRDVRQSVTNLICPQPASRSRCHGHESAGGRGQWPCYQRQSTRDGGLGFREYYQWWCQCQLECESEAARCVNQCIYYDSATRPAVAVVGGGRRRPWPQPRQGQRALSRKVTVARWPSHGPRHCPGDGRGRGRRHHLEGWVMLYNTPPCYITGCCIAFYVIQHPWYVI